MATVAAQKAEALRTLLKERFPGTTLLDRPERGVFPSGIQVLDELLPGGAPRGAITLFSGDPASGKLGVAFTIVSRATLQGHAVAWVHLGGFSPPSALGSGVELGRLLEVRATSEVQAQRCVDHLVRYAAFPLVVLDWPGRSGPSTRWTRLQHLVVTGNAALIVLGPCPEEGEALRFAASVHLHHTRAPEAEGKGIVARVRVSRLRSRYAPPGGEVCLEAEGLGPFPLLPDLSALRRRAHDDP